jgi:23S rRNA pseudouridine1911/1915/1917 synthase
LDKDTSGLMLVAKSRTAQTALQRLASDDAIEKEYLAIVAGKPPAAGLIDLAIDRDPWDARRVTVRDRGGVPSVTRFRRLRSVAVASDRHLSLLRCRLITGRTHQIRVHLAAKGWPIVGDAIYGIRHPDIQRQALHAWRVAFRHPVSEIEIDVTAPPPEDMAALLRAFE